MSGSLEEAYVAVERAYGQGDFAGALQLAQALQPQVPPGRPDLLDQRLQLLLGHIHLYGLNQPARATVAYTAVLGACSEPSYRELANQGLEISRQQLAQSPPAAEAAMPPPASATPWLNQLQDPQQALHQIQKAGATGTPAQPAAGDGAATPWESGGGAAPAPVEQHEQAAASVSLDKPPAPAGPAGSAAEDKAADASSELAVQTTEGSDGEPEDPQAIVPVVVTVEEEETVPEQPPTPAATPEPEVPAATGFSAEEWADFQRGVLLVELTTSNAGPTR